MISDAQLGQWQLLHRELDRQSIFAPTPSLRIIFVLCMVLSPLSGALYGLSLIKRVSARSERWLVRKDSDGYYHPNASVVIPVWATLYTIADMISLVTCYSDLGSHPRSITSATEILKYAFLLGMAWTKVWATIYAAPRSRFQIQHNKPITSGSDSKTTQMRRWLLPMIFNISMALGYLIQMIVSVTLCTYITTSMKQIKDLMYKFDALSEIVTALSSTEASNILFPKSFTYLISMQGVSRKLARHLRVGFYIYFFITAFMFIALSLATAVILKALYFQLGVLKRAAIRPRRMASNIDLYCPQTPVVLIPDQASTFTLKKSPGTFSEKRSGSPCSQIEPWDNIDRRSDWLPTFKRGTGIDELMWRLPAFSENFDEDNLDVGLKAEQYRILKTYTVNIIWQQALTCAVVVSYLAMLGLMISTWCKEELGLPLPRVLLILVEWSNLTWNLGIGFTLGLISCFVSFSPIPSHHEQEHHESSLQDREPSYSEGI
ncbi:hypothetical protein DFH28DRAFT_975818 [Melampsora americana]|nr:hypothetical protein DFH28DRAFT_975818 [Melampsora americana]